MLLSLAWLKEFVPYTGTAEELGAKLTMLGLELENISNPYKVIEPIVIGYIKECGKHPEADKLSVCLVDVGQESPLQIVCGAPNVGQGQYVPVALVGTTMPEGMKIKKAKLRNVVSMGMICSERELQLSDDHKGIMILNDILPEEKLVLGASLVEALNLDTEILEIGITPNRADCLSVLGFAREVAQAYNLPLTLPKCELKVDDTKNDTQMTTDVDKNLSPYYTGRVLDNPTIGDSPTWMKFRLNAVGVRSISNVVDATNYVLMELGLPLHAFDRDCISSDTICVISAKDDEKYTTLDGQERTLKAGDILIADKEKPVGLGGVMGGLNSEITDNTKRIFLEAAVFNPSNIRKTARRLALSSEASYRFERGVDMQIVDFARDRCAYLIQELTGATCKNGVVTTEKHSPAVQHIPFNYQRCLDLLGFHVPQEFCENTLEGLGCTLEKNGEDYIVTPPSWRADLSREADLFEEIVRVYGVDAIPEEFPPILKSLQLSGKAETRHPFLIRVRHFMAGMGLNECMCYSFVGHDDLDRLNIPKEPRVSIANPLTAEQNVLRTDLAPGLLNALKVNMGQGNTSIKLFEIAQSFVQDPSSETKVHETRRMGILLTGQRHSHFPHNKHTEEFFDYADLKGIVETFFANFLNLPLKMVKAESHPYLSPAVKIVLSGSPLADAGDIVAVMGRIKPEIADYYNAREHVWYAEINLCSLRGLSAAKTIQFQALPVYPPVRRDITVITPLNMEVQTIIDTLYSTKTPLLKHVEMHDSYKPSKDAQEHNLTFRLLFRSDSKTLQDTEVDKEKDKLVRILTEKLEVRV